MSPFQNSFRTSEERHEVARNPPVPNRSLTGLTGGVSAKQQRFVGSSCPNEPWGRDAPVPLGALPLEQLPGCSPKLAAAPPDVSSDECPCRRISAMESSLNSNQPRKDRS